MTEGDVVAAHLMVVDDDPRIRSMLTKYFEAEGFRVSVAEDGVQLWQTGLTAIDLILLDIGLPGEDGLTLTREIRAVSQTAIIIISGRGDDIDRVVGLEIGADDYITKPFNLREVLARVRSVLRRTQPMHVSQLAEESELITRFDGWTLNHARRQLVASTGQCNSLTAGEFDLLEIFVKYPGRPLSRDFLMDQTRGHAWEVFDRSIDAQVARLRRKIECNRGAPELIKSVRGIGYVFTGRPQRS